MHEGKYVYCIYMESIPYQWYLRRLCELLIAFAIISACGLHAQHAPHIDTIYILPSSHWDLGFIRTPEDEQAAIKPHLDAVLAACRNDPQFRWTVESIWQLQAWLQRTPDSASQNQMAEHIRNGQIEVSAAWGSMHTEFMGTEELNRLIDDERLLAVRFHIRGDMAMLNDVPGFSLRLPQVLARSGVKYLVNGSNTFIAGGTSLSPAHIPFYWAAPDGSRVLTWQTQGKNGGYTEGMADYYLDPAAKDPYLHTTFYPKQWQGLSDMEITRRGVAKLISHYADAGFKGHVIAVLYMHDGIGPEYEQSLLKNVRAWNKAGRQPRLKVATPHEYFATIEQGANAEESEQPTYSGDWSGLWSEVKTNSPHLSADARWIQLHLPEAEEASTIASIEHSKQPYPAQSFADAQTNLFRYDEHNGAGNGGWPKVLTEEQVNRSNAEYAQYVRSARNSVETALDSHLTTSIGQPETDHSDDRILVVSNRSSWVRSGIVTLDATQSPFTVIDAETGADVPLQAVSDTELDFLARSVPPFGYRAYRLRSAAQPLPAPRVADAMATHAENQRYALDVDPQTGEIVHLIDKLHGLDLAANRNFGAAIREHDNGQLLAAAARITIRHVSGPVEDRLVIHRADSWWPETILSLPRDLAELQIVEVLDRAKMPVVNMHESADRYSFHFPFRFDEEPQRWIDDGIGFHRLPQDYLPGARTDAAVPRFTVALSGTAGHQSLTVLLAQRESFFIRFSGASGTPEVTAMKKSDQAETKDHGIVTFPTYEPGYSSLYYFHFSVASADAGLDPVSAYRFGRDEASPLLTALLPQYMRPASWSRSSMSVSSSHVVLEALHPSRTGQPRTYLVRLQEVAGIPAVTKLTLPRTITTADEIDETDTTVLRPSVDADHLALKPHQSLTLRVTLAADAVAAPRKTLTSPQEHSQ